MGETIHRKTFDGGRSTPAEMHRKLVFGGHVCDLCGDPAAIKARFLADDEEFRRRHPDAYMLLIQKFGGDPAFDTKYGKMVCIEEVYGCDRCKDSLRKLAAQKQKDFMMVEFDEGGLESSYPTVVGAGG